MMVAIEMITYNHGPYIRQAIESVMAQKTSFPYCLYVFEDCSTDATAEICRELAAKYPEKIRLNLNAVNLGVGRNAKLMHDTTYGSDAKYIAMCDGDDYWADDKKLQKQVDFLEQHPDFNLCCSNVYLKREPGGKPVARNEIGADQTYSIEDLAKAMFVNTVSAVFRNGTVRLPAWTVTSSAGDYLIFLLSARTGLIRYLGQPTAVYRLHQQSDWASRPIYKQLQDSIGQLDLMQQEFDGEIARLLKGQADRLRFELLKQDADDAVRFEQTLKLYLNDSDDELKDYVLEKLRAVLAKEKRQTIYKRNIWRALRNRLRFFKQ